MKLYGMLDSPYVRRVAISLDLYGIDYEHVPLSVFNTFEAFALVNPVVKAPSLVFDDGTVLLDSSLILDQFEHQAIPSKRLLPQEPAARAKALRVVGLALAACDKAVQIVYERQLRPEDKQHRPWLQRVTGQLSAACEALQMELADGRGVTVERLDQASVAVAVAWSFIELMVSNVIKADDFPRLATFTRQLEASALFRKYPML